MACWHSVGCAVPDVAEAVGSTPNLDAVLAAIAESARSLGIETYLVGGFVRDSVLDQPGKDIDLLAVDADGVPVLAAVAKRFGWSRPQVFDRFGTGQIRGDGFIIEVVRARAEQYDPLSRRPAVRPGTLDEDVWRRDFTVNALCRTMDGQVIDRTGRGLDDLRAGILRTPLDPVETFSEDPLRLFRAARFVAQLGFRLADGVLEAMTATAERARILSVERIAVELRRLLTSAHPRAGMEVLRASGLCAETLPELLPMVGVAQGGYHIHDVWDHSMHALQFAPPEFLTRLAALLHDIGKPATHEVAPDGRHTFYDHPAVGARIAAGLLARLRFSNDEIAAVTTLIRLHLRPIQYDHSTFGDAAVRRLIRDAGPFRRQLLDVARADTWASAYPGTAAIDELASRMDQLDSGGAVTAMRAPLDGHELMEIAGRGPGRWLGRVVSALTDAMIEGDIAAGDKPGARAWLAARPELLQTD